MPECTLKARDKVRVKAKESKLRATEKMRVRAIECTLKVRDKVRVRIWTRSFVLRFDFF